MSPYKGGIQPTQQPVHYRQSLIKRSQSLLDHELLAGLTSIYWWPPACLQALPRAGKAGCQPVPSGMNRIIKAKENSLCWDTDSLNMDSYSFWKSFPEDACIWAQMQWEKVTAWNWEQRGKMKRERGRKREKDCNCNWDQPSQAKQEKQLRTTFRKKKPLTWGAERASCSAQRGF